MSCESPGVYIFIFAAKYCLFLEIRSSDSHLQIFR